MSRLSNLEEVQSRLELRGLGLKDDVLQMLKDLRASSQGDSSDSDSDQDGTRKKKKADKPRFVSEDFGLSQFWYTVRTALSLAREVVCGGAALDDHSAHKDAIATVETVFQRLYARYDQGDTKEWSTFEDDFADINETLPSDKEEKGGQSQRSSDVPPGFTSAHMRVACVSCPSTYLAVRRLLAECMVAPAESTENSKPQSKEQKDRAAAVRGWARGVCCVLLEYDPRFACHGAAFVRYDCHKPTQVPKWCLGSFQVVVADPPYLNKDTLHSTVRTMHLLGGMEYHKSLTDSSTDTTSPAKTYIDKRSSSSTEGSGDSEPVSSDGDSTTQDGESKGQDANPSLARMMICTGRVLLEPIGEYGWRPQRFLPRHSCKLSNEFRCYSNYNTESLGGPLDLDRDDEGYNLEEHDMLIQ